MREVEADISMQHNYKSPFTTAGIIAKNLMLVLVNELLTGHMCTNAEWAQYFVKGIGLSPVVILVKSLLGLRGWECNLKQSFTFINPLTIVALEKCNSVCSVILLEFIILKTPNYNP